MQKLNQDLSDERLATESTRNPQRMLRGYYSEEAHAIAAHWLVQALP